MEESHLNFLKDKKILSIKNEEISFHPDFLKSIVVPSLGNRTEILTKSTILLSEHSIYEDDLPTYLSLISAMLEHYGLEDIDEQMDVFS